MSQREAKLRELGFDPDVAPSPGAIYRPVAVNGTTAYCSGAVPLENGELQSKGKVSSEVSVEEAQQAAALCAANCLRMAKHALGSLERIKRITRVTGYVNSDPDFTEQHIVINGASQLLVDVFGEDEGLAARSAIGMAQLPLGCSVEVEMILELNEPGD
ncbi:MAG: RidA family protein [Planctomycetota bacterium]|nr:RidA family protein [Planctomycetota bacterium]